MHKKCLLDIQKRLITESCKLGSMDFIPTKYKTKRRKKRSFIMDKLFNFFKKLKLKQFSISKLFLLENMDVHTIFCGESHFKKYLITDTLINR